MNANVKPLNIILEQKKINIYWVLIKSIQSHA